MNPSCAPKLKSKRATYWVGAAVVTALTAACSVHHQPLQMYKDVGVLEQAYVRAAPDPTPTLILGTFHFLGSATDERSVQGLNMLSNKRQLEINEVLARLVEFQPTHIAVEVNRSQQGQLDDRYRDYLSGQYELTANEIDQIAFRLAKILKHERLYAIDAIGRSYSSSIDAEEFARKTSQQELLTDPIETAWQSMHDKKDELVQSRTLIEHLRVINNARVLSMSHSIYLTQSLGVTDGQSYPFADGFVSKWYNRNLRIFGNLVALPTNGNDRILALIGSGHVPILRHLAENSGALQVIDVADVLPPQPQLALPCILWCRSEVGSGATR